MDEYEGIFYQQNPFFVFVLGGETLHICNVIKRKGANIKASKEALRKISA
jgi:hypothetical protein